MDTAIWPRGVTVSTLDSESSDRGSNPREASSISRMNTYCWRWGVGAWTQKEIKQDSDVILQTHAAGRAFHIFRDRVETAWLHAA